MRSTHNHSKWLEGVRLFGFDEPGDKPGDEPGDEPGEEDEEEEEEPGDEGGDSGDTAGLKSALRKERKARRAAEKEAKALKKQKETSNQQEQEDLAATKASLETEQQKTIRLAAKFAEKSVNDEVRRQAREMRFIDEDVAVTMINRELVEFDQDDDDPASVDVDKDSVKEALDDLKTRKPHLLVAEGDEDASGSKFGGPRGKPPKKKTAEQLAEEAKALYPAMRNRA